MFLTRPICCSAATTMSSNGPILRRFSAFAVLLALLNGSLLGPVLHRHDSCCSSLQAPAEKTISASDCSCSFHSEPCGSETDQDPCSEDQSPARHGSPGEHDQNCGICFVLAQSAVTSFEPHFEVLSGPSSTIIVLSDSSTDLETPTVSARGPPVI